MRVRGESKNRASKDRMRIRQERGGRRWWEMRGRGRQRVGVGPGARRPGVWLSVAPVCRRRTCTSPSCAGRRRCCWWRCRTSSAASAGPLRGTGNGAVETTSTCDRDGHTSRAPRDVERQQPCRGPARSWESGKTRRNPAHAPSFADDGCRFAMFAGGGACVLCMHLANPKSAIFAVARFPDSFRRIFSSFRSRWTQSNA